MSTIRVTDLGPVQSLEIPIPEGGGVVVLRGHNGAGKSFALRAARALVEGPKSDDLPARDGTNSAEVEGLGAVVKFGRRRSGIGHVEVQGLEGLDPATLVDPGLKDPEAADRARLRALCTLAGVRTDRARFLALAPVDGERIVPVVLSDDLVEAAGAAKRAMEGEARRHELAGEELRAKARGAMESLGPAVDADDPEAAGEASSLATVALVRLEERQRAARERIAAAATARQERDGLGEALSVEDAEAARSEWEARVARVREELVAADAGYREAVLAVVHAKRDAAARSALDAAIAAAEGVEPIGDDAVSEARRIADEARERHAVAVAAGKTADSRKAAEERMALGRSESELGERWREACAACWGLVEESVSTVAPDGLVIRDGRIYAQTDRGDEPWEDLSHGERWRWALDIASRALGAKGGGLIVARQEAWEGLDPENRALVARLCRERKIVMLTAEADGGEIRAEVAPE